MARQIKLTRLFRSDQFNFQAKRTLGHAVYGGALPGEVFALLPAIKDGDGESWYANWYRMATASLQVGEAASDATSRGYALLRAANYFRASEFFLARTDARRPDIYRQSIRTFQAALADLGIAHQVHRVPYEHGQMRTYYFPGRPGKPLFVVHGGFDATNEEGYFLIAAPLIERGYPVVMFEGPGQSSMLKDYGIHFTPDWHRPLGAVLDFIDRDLPELAASKRIAVGISLGGLLAARAAAVERRIDGVVVFGAPFDMLDAALSMSRLLRVLYNAGRGEVINRVVRLKMRLDVDLWWAMDNGMYTFGIETPYQLLRATAAYTLRDVHDKITCDTLVLRGEDDVYGPGQAALFRTAFPNARSYTIREFDRAGGASEHCQIGAVEHAAQEILTWLQDHDIERPTTAASVQAELAAAPGR